MRGTARGAFLLLSLLPAACGRDTLVLSGSLVPGSEVTEVFVLGDPARAAVEADSFRLEGIEGDTLDLRFAVRDGEPARMQLVGLPREGEIWLEGIWISDGVAHAARLHAARPEAVTVNGLRMRGVGTMPAQLDAEGTVLAVTRDGDALLLRPADEALPDLRVVITPGTLVRTVEGEPREAEELEAGDPVRVSGQGVEGYVVATEVVLPGPGSE